MDLNYLLRREQEELHLAQTSPSRSARSSHSRLALEYGRLLQKSTYPHTRLDQRNQHLAAPRRTKRENREEAWENEGGAVRSHRYIVEPTNNKSRG